MISIIIPMGGRVKENITAKSLIDKNNTSDILQTYKDFEIIETRFYNFYQGYNLAWNRNIGAKDVKGDILIFMDSDLKLEKDYLEKVLKIKDDFASGSNCYIMGNKKFPGYDKKSGMGYGLILIFKRDFYFNKFGGFIENFFRYGYEDNEAADRIMKLLNKDESQIERIDSSVRHVQHEGRDLYNNKTNKEIYNKLITKDVKKRCELAKNGGNIESPYIINIDKL